MSYLALYRKFRPDRFEEVKGQDAIVTTLRNQIVSGRIGHAYLFCGTRGTGKTTVAKIFAKAVNCGHPINGSPCGACAMCRSISAGSSMNVIEIDAASNNGVDNIREIKEEVAYRPTEGRYKVYIIDEVHMLSIGAFNALLKTLEEPPEYVIFILATTEAHKIPVTILSRCQRYDFKRMTIGTISAHLNELIEKEGWDVEDKAVRYIARVADGSMRDALSLLDQCAAFYMDQRLTYDHVLEVLGTVDAEVFSRLLRRLIAMDVRGVLDMVDELVMQGREVTQLTADFIWYLRNLLLVSGSDGMEDALDMSTENIARLKEEAAMVEDHTLIRYIRVFSELSGQMKMAAQKRVLLEVALIKLCRPQMETSYDALLERIRAVEKKLEEGTCAAAATGSGGSRPDTDGREAGASASGVDQKPASRQKRGLPKALSADVEMAARMFHRAISQEASELVKYSAKNGQPGVGEDGQLQIVFPEKYRTSAEILKQESHLKEVKDILRRKVGKEVEVGVYILGQAEAFEDRFAAIDGKINMELTVED